MKNDDPSISESRLHFEFQFSFETILEHSFRVLKLMELTFDLEIPQITFSFSGDARLANFAATSDQAFRTPVN